MTTEAKTRTVDRAFWHGKRVFLTGQTGFKGSWLGMWLVSMGARVTGYALAPNTTPALFDLLDLEAHIDHHVGNICDKAPFIAALRSADPDVVLHLAAQPIVSEGYKDPLETFETNTMGTAYLLEACRSLKRQVPIVVVSSDKCYLNNDTGRAFQVNDPLGGHDPYSASKACTEIVTSAYRASFFTDPAGPAIASARAGNVVGGGDWSVNRLLPDCVRAFSTGASVTLRDPIATRPWQHVLEPIYGYLVLAQALCEDRSFATAWNFGPSDRNHQTVGYIANKFRDSWGDGAQVVLSDEKQEWREAKTLDLDCAQTLSTLGWAPLLGVDETVDWTVDWYKSVSQDQDTAEAVTLEQIQIYEMRQADAPVADPQG